MEGSGFRRARRSFARTLIAFVVLLPAFGVVTTSAAVAAEDPSVVGEWTAPFDIGVIAIHSVLLPNGKVLLFEKPATSGTGSKARVFDPVTGFVSGPPPSATLQNADIADPRDLFCATQSLTSDGDVVVVGGRLYGADIDTGNDFTTIYHPGSSTWSYGPTLTEPRWYATTTEIGDGRILIFSGLSTPGVFVTPVDAYDPATGTLSRFPSSADLKLALYPRMFVMPDGRLVKVGPEPPTKIFDPATATWSTLTTMDGASRSGEMAVLLPGNRKILVAGGGSPGVATARILDLSSPSPTWRPTASMNAARRWGNGVMLADGTVLAVGGGADSSYTGPVFNAELFDPVSETWTTMAAQQASRMYHSTAILLPDGRVLSAGQTNGTMQETAEIYSPPYLFHGPRPAITGAPSSVQYGASFQITTPDAADVSRVALVRPGSATHSMHFDQRYVDLQYSKGTGTLTATAPPNGNEAPPGWYMLFVLNSAGVPSMARWVRVAGGPGGPPANQAPVVNAGADQDIVLPATASLAGTASDDHLPSPPDHLTTTWSKVSGPGAVTFGNPSALQTSASFSATGTYVLKLTADDSALSSSDQLTVNVTDTPPPPTNQPPTVSAGADQSVVLPNTAALSGSVTDDHLPNPPDAVTTTWSMVSGPGTVTFGNASALQTTASFSAAGTYVLELTGNDSALSASDQLTVNVSAAGGSATLEVRVAVGSDDAEEKTTTGDTPVASTDLQMTMAGTVRQLVGLRFKVAIPAGATITNAYVQFESDEVSTGASSLTIQGQAADNPPTFKNVIHNISSRPRTAASVAWTPPTWPTIQVHGPAQQTPNLATIVQQLVNRTNWKSGNAIVLIVTGTGKRTAESKNGTYAPLLHIEYQT